jgi:hypothetical protein
VHADVCDISQILSCRTAGSHQTSSRESGIYNTSHSPAQFIYLFIVLKQKTESIAGRSQNRKRENPRDSSILPSSLKMNEE